MSLLASTWTRGHLCHPCTMTVLFSFINLSSLKKLQEKEKGHVGIHRLECLYNNASKTTMINSVLHPINNKAFNDANFFLLPHFLFSWRKKEQMIKVVLLLSKSVLLVRRSQYIFRYPSLS